MTDYKPGAIARITDVDGTAEIALCVRPGTAGGEYAGRAKWRTASDELLWSSVTDIRPLIVLDLEYPEGLLATLRDAQSHMVPGGPNYGRLSGLIDQIEAQTRPPEPPEPTETGALVEAVYEDSDGKGFGPATWARAGDGSWVCLTDGCVGMTIPWPFLKRVEVKP